MTAIDFIQGVTSVIELVVAVLSLMFAVAALKLSRQDHPANKSEEADNDT